eukprot:g932.t1
MFAGDDALQLAHGEIGERPIARGRVADDRDLLQALRIGGGDLHIGALRHELDDRALRQDGGVGGDGAFRHRASARPAFGARRPIAADYAPRRGRDKRPFIGTGEIPILTFRAITGFLAGGALLALARFRHGSAAPLRRDWRGIALCGFVGVTAWFYLSALSVTLLPASRAALLAYTMPFWAFVIGVVFLREPVGLRRVFGVAAGVSAILLMAWDDVAAAVGGAGVVFPWGVAAITAAAIVWSVGSTLQKEMAFRSPVMQVAGWQLLIGAAPLAALALALEPTAWIETVGPRALLATAGVALITCCCWASVWGSSTRSASC